MYGLLLTLHSIVRWLVLAGILVPLARTYAAIIWPRPWSKPDRVGITVATMATHTQLLIGLALYISSPFVSYFWAQPSAAAGNRQLLFFSLIHITGMITSVVLITVGSSLAKRAEDDRQRFRSIAVYWTIAIVVILLLIPWPFSPLAQRPLLRVF